MKNLLRYTGVALIMTAATLTSCSPDDFPELSETGIPVAAEYADAVDIQVNQETNEVTFSLKAPKAMPYWYFEGQKQNPYSIVNGMKRIYTVAGDYNVDVRIVNANGISDGTISKSFTVNNTLFDFAKYENFIAGDNTKEWYIAKDAEGHMGCGPSGTDGYEWWKARPNEHSDKGIYDDVVTFSKDKSYNYNPGAGGTMYINKDCTQFEEFRGDSPEDFKATVEAQTATWSFEVDGPDLFLVFPPKTQFPYIANDDFWANPRMKVLSMNAKKMELLFDNGVIAWHYILTTEKEEIFNGFKYDSEFNLWKQATVKEPTFFYAPRWSQIANPEYTHEGATYKVTLPAATFEQWQAQMKLESNISTSAASSYDFSIILNSSTKHGGVTVKLVDATNDDNFYFTEKVALNPGEDAVLFKSGMKGIDISTLALVLDFGGNADNTEITVQNIVLKDHANDDGTKLPEDKPVEDNIIWNEDAPLNLWKGTPVNTDFFYADANWAPHATAPTITPAGTGYQISLPLPTVMQWQAQIFFHTGMTAKKDGVYDFRCSLKSNNDIKNATVKLVQSNEDDVDNSANFFFTTSVSLISEEEFILKMPAIVAPCDMQAISLVLDFGGNPENTEITFDKVIFQNHMEKK